MIASREKLQLFVAAEQFATGVAARGQVLMHRIPRYAVATACAQQVSGCDGLSSTGSSKGHAHTLRIIWRERKSVRA
jgi:hypothetical protein